MHRGRFIKRLYATATLPILVVGLAIGAVAFAQAQEGGSFTADLQVLNESGATGNATATLDGNTLTVEIETSGLTPNAPHAQHLHIGGTNTCPDASADADGDGLVNAAEGVPSYGPIQVSLTTEGDASADSGLAVDRMPVADDSGAVSYSRTFELPAGVTPDMIANAVVVQHGVDVNASGVYDGDAPSELDPSLPLEATLPANCGPHEAVDAGGGVASPTPDAGTGGAAASPTPGTGITVPDTGSGPAGGGASATVLVAATGLGVLGLLAVGYTLRKQGRERI